jgi:hypothetical protein
MQTDDAPGQLTALSYSLHARTLPDCTHVPQGGARARNQGILMTSSSILGGERAARQAPGRDADALGPSDSSDSGSDVQGEPGSATGPDNADIVPDHIVRADADVDELAEDRLDTVDVDALESDDEEPDPQDDLFDEPRPPDDARRP